MKLDDDDDAADGEPNKTPSEISDYLRKDSNTSRSFVSFKFMAWVICAYIGIQTQGQSKLLNTLFVVIFFLDGNSTFK